MSADPPSTRSLLRRWLPLALVGLALVLVVRYSDQLLGLLGRLRTALSPLIIGIFLAFVLNLPMRWLERQLARRWQHAQGRRVVALVASVLLFLGVAILMVRLVLPNLIATANLIVEQAPGTVQHIQAWIEERVVAMPWLHEQLQSVSIDWMELGQSVIARVVEGTGNVLSFAIALVSGIFGATFNLFLGLLFAFYILMTKETLGRQIKRLLAVWIPKRGMQRLQDVIDMANVVFSKFTLGQLSTAALLGVSCTVGMWIMRIPYAGMSGAMLGVTSLIPLFGTVIGGAIGMFMIATVNLMQSLIFLLYIIILQQIVSNIIYPRIVGNQVGLPGFWVLIAILVGIGLFGMIGILLAVPVAATAYRLLGKWLNSAPDKDYEARHARRLLRRSRLSAGEERAASLTLLGEDEAQAEGAADERQSD